MAASPRSLTEDLRARDDVALRELLRERPDLAVPRPVGIGGLAVRAAQRASVQRVVDRLDSPSLQVVEVLAALPEPVAPAEVSRCWGHDAGPVLCRLRLLGLVWGGARSLRLVRAGRDLLGPHPAGLGPPVAEVLGRRSPQRLAELLEDLGLAVTADPEVALQRLAGYLGSAEVLGELLHDAPAAARAALDRLTWGPPVGSLPEADRAVRAGAATSPVEWLLARGLLGVADAAHVVLPREVGMALRGGKVHRRPDLAPPEAVPARVPADRVAATAAAEAAEAVRLVAALGELWAAQPPPVLRSGGLGVRDLRRTAAGLGVDETTGALLVEVAYAAGLLAQDGEVGPSWMPTPAFDGWLAGSTAHRWSVLASAWLAMSRVPGLVGSRDLRDTPRPALGPDLDRVMAAPLRRSVLADLAAGSDRDGKGSDRDGQGSDQVGLAVADPDLLAARLDWSAPRQASRLRQDMVAWTLREAGRLGVLGSGALAPAGRALLYAGPGEAAAKLQPALPVTVDHVLLQADLTAVAPGQLEPGLAREMELVAEVESRGAATVYRFTPASVRRALDAGRTGEELIAFLTGHSRTEPPQPLAYLLRDTARRHGRLRVGATSAYLRADDEALIGELVADRRLAGLRLRRLAPTVLVSPAPPETVLELLRDSGRAPAAEGADGDLMVHRAPARRTPPTSSPRPLPASPWGAVDDAGLDAVVRLLRAADADDVAATGGPVGRPTLVPLDPPAALALLRGAISNRSAVWIGYADTSGASHQRLVEPIAVTGGRVTALDREDGRERTYSVHRIVGVAAAT